MSLTFYVASHKKLHFLLPALWPPAVLCWMQHVSVVWACFTFIISVFAACFLLISSCSLQLVCSFLSAAARGSDLPSYLQLQRVPPNVNVLGRCGAFALVSHRTYQQRTLLSPAPTRGNPPVWKIWATSRRLDRVYWWWSVAWWQQTHRLTSRWEITDKNTSPVPLHESL